LVSPRIALGRAGEERAVKHLTSLGYEVIERNYRCHHGEIDIVARDGSTLVFIEVKTRRSREFGSGSEAVGNPKRKKIIQCAQEYIVLRNCEDVDARYDVVEVYFQDGQPVTVEVVKGAFWEEE